MASTDIDGNPIVIMSKDEARTIYNRLIFIKRLGQSLTDVEQGLIHKIVRDLEIRERKMVSYRGHQYDSLDSEGLSGGKE